MPLSAHLLLRAFDRPLRAALQSKISGARARVGDLPTMESGCNHVHSLF